MKIFYRFVLLISILCLTLGAACLYSVRDPAFAETVGNATVTEITAAADYMKLERPTNVVVSSDYTIAFDCDRFSILNKGTTYFIDRISSTKIEEMFVISDFLIVFHEVDADGRAFELYDLASGVSMDASTFDILNLGDAEYPSYPFSITFDTSGAHMYALYPVGCYQYDYHIDNGIFSIASVGDTPIVRQYQAARAGAIKLTYLNGWLYFLQYNISAYSLGRYSVSDGDSIENFRDIAIDMSENSVTLCAGDRYLLVTSHTDLTYECQLFDTLSADNYSTTFPTINGIYLFGDYLYVSEADNSRIIRYSYSKNSKEKLVETNVFAFKGSNSFLLNEPTCVVEDAGELYIADSGNARICRYELDGNQKVSTIDVYYLRYEGQPLYPRLLAKWNDSIYFTTFDRAYIFNMQKGTVNALSMDAMNVISLSSCKNKLYLATERKAYTYENARLTEIFECRSTEKIISISVSKTGNTAFATTTNAIYCINPDRTQTVSPITYTAGITPKGTLSDSKSNAYFFYSKGDEDYLCIYARRLEGYVAECEIRCDCDCFNNGLFGIFPGSDGRYYATVTADNLLEVLDVSTYYTPDHNSGQADTPIERHEQISVLYCPPDTKLYDSYLNYDLYTEQVEESLQVSVAYFEHDGYQWYEITNASGQTAYVSAADVSIVNNTEKVFELGMPRLNNVVIYRIPIADDRYRITSIQGSNTCITVSETVGYYSDDLDLGMSLVRYENVIGYARTKRMIEYSPNQLIEASTRTMQAVRVNTGDLTVKLPVYASADNTGEVLAELKDNTVVSIESTLDYNSKYTKIVFNGSMEGYVETAYLIQNGMTEMTVKIVLFAIILALMAIIIPVVLKFTLK